MKGKVYAAVISDIIVGIGIFALVYYHNWFFQEEWRCVLLVFVAPVLGMYIRLSYYTFKDMDDTRIVYVRKKGRGSPENVQADIASYVSKVRGQKGKTHPGRDPGEDTDADFWNPSARSVDEDMAKVLLERRKAVSGKEAAHGRVDPERGDGKNPEAGKRTSGDHKKAKKRDI